MLREGHNLVGLTVHQDLVLRTAQPSPDQPIQFQPNPDPPISHVENYGILQNLNMQVLPLIELNS